MRIERTKNTVRNIIFGSVLKIVNIILPFASRTVILYILGAQYLGINSLFHSILSFLSLAELGVGAALIYTMYKPIAENDTTTIKAIINFSDGVPRKRNNVSVHQVDLAKIVSEIVYDFKTKNI